MAGIIDFAANFLIVSGVVLMALGIYGTFKFHDFFKRILITGKVDTVGFIIVILGLILKIGISFFSLKLILVLALYVITNPIGTHATLRSADLSKYKIKKETLHKND